MKVIQPWVHCAKVDILAVQFNLLWSVVYSKQCVSCCELFDRV